MSRAAVAARLEQREEDRGGHVVGKVAGDPKVASGDRPQVEVEEVLLDERDVRRQPWRQCLRHLAVQLDGGQVGDERREPERERARARTDLEKAIGRLRGDRLHQPVCPRRLEEVLSEPLLRPDARGDRASHVVQRFTAPVLLFDFLDLVFAHAEVVAELVDDGFGDAVADLVVVFAGLLDRNLVDRDAIRQRVAVAPAALGEGSALVEAEERVVRVRPPSRRACAATARPRRRPRRSSSRCGTGAGSRAGRPRRAR